MGRRENAYGGVAAWIASAGVMIACLVPTTTSAVETKYRVTDLSGSIAGIGESLATSINDVGQVVGVAHRGVGERAFIWDANVGMRDLGSIPDGYNQSVAWRINNVGLSVGRISQTAAGGPGFHSRAVAWTADGALQEIGLPPDRYSYSQALSVNDAGFVAVDADGAFVWSAATGFLDIGRLDNSLSPSGTTPRAINNKSQIVGYSATTHGTEPFLWSATDGMVDLGDLPGGDNTSGDAFDINEAGEIVGHSNGTLGQRAFLWTANGGLLDLGDIPGYDGSTRTENLAFAINNHGRIVGRTGTSATIAFLWTQTGGMQDLNSLIDPTDPLYGRAIVSQALDINDQGQIIGEALIGGARRAVLLTPVPEPTTAMLMIVGVLTICAGVGSRRPHRHMGEDERSGTQSRANR